MSAPSSSTLGVVLLLSRDPDRTAAFYQEVLGLKLQAEEHDGRLHHYGGTTGSIYFTIQHGSDLPDPAPVRGPDSMQLCFTVQDMAAFVEHLEKCGVQALHTPQPFEHTTYLTLRDPDGRTLRVMTPWA